MWAHANARSSEGVAWSTHRGVTQKETGEEHIRILVLDHSHVLLGCGVIEGALAISTSVGEGGGLVLSGRSWNGMWREGLTSAKLSTDEASKTAPEATKLLSAPCATLEVNAALEYSRAAVLAPRIRR